MGGLKYALKDACKEVLLSTTGLVCTTTRPPSSPPSSPPAKVDMNKSVPLVEDVQVGKVTLGVQYDTGCQLSIISKSALSALPPSMYSLGTSSRIRMITYAGEGKTILTTAVKLRLPGATLTLSAIEEDLNNGSGFSFPVPSKWRSLMGSSTATLRTDLYITGWRQ